MKSWTAPSPDMMHHPLTQGWEVLIIKDAEHQVNTTPDRIPGAGYTKMLQHITVGCKMSQHT